MYNLGSVVSIMPAKCSVVHVKKKEGDGLSLKQPSNVHDINLILLSFF